MKHQKIIYPLKNAEFLKVVSNSFKDFLTSGSSRSTAKLKPLHGAIAMDLAKKLGRRYKIISQGYKNNSEEIIKGRYIDKRVDITIKKKNKPIAGIAVKFIMQNYSQNSNNYFENMLGETANIRSSNYPYFQIIVILDRLPYYKKNKSISKWEMFTEHNALKYLKLSHDDINTFFHTPNKTLIYIIHIPDNSEIKNLEEYLEYYLNLDFKIELSSNFFKNCGNSVIINDYELFIEKIYHTIMAL